MELFVIVLENEGFEKDILGSGGVKKSFGHGLPDSIEHFESYPVSSAYLMIEFTNLHLRNKSMSEQFVKKETVCFNDD